MRQKLPDLTQCADVRSKSSLLFATTSHRTLSVFSPTQPTGSWTFLQPAYTLCPYPLPRRARKLEMIAQKTRSRWREARKHKREKRMTSRSRSRTDGSRSQMVGSEYFPTLRYLLDFMSEK